jgi:hypothetical protein
VNFVIAVFSCEKKIAQPNKIWGSLSKAKLVFVELYGKV